MSDYPSDLGHWERINESASAVNYGRDLDMHAVVEDVCRALIDLHHRLNQIKAAAWDEGHADGQAQRARKIINTYREDSHD